MDHKDDDSDDGFPEIVDELTYGHRLPASTIRDYSRYNVSDQDILTNPCIRTHWDWIREETKDDIRQVFDNLYIGARRIMRNYIIESKEHDIDPLDGMYASVYQRSPNRELENLCFYALNRAIILMNNEMSVRVPSLRDMKYYAKCLALLLTKQLIVDLFEPDEEHTL